MSGRRGNVVSASSTELRHGSHRLERPWAGLADWTRCRHHQVGQVVLNDVAVIMSEQDFGRSVAGACPSERQYYRVALLDYLTAQYPNIDSGAHLATANRAVESAQKDIVTAFVRHRPPAK